MISWAGYGHDGCLDGKNVSCMACDHQVSGRWYVFLFKDEDEDDIDLLLP